MSGACVTCETCHRLFDTERGMKIHWARKHKGRRRTSRDVMVSPNPSPPIRFERGLVPLPRRRYYAVYVCGHRTLLASNWNPVVMHPDQGPYEGYCKPCDEMLPINHFLEVDQATLAGLSPEPAA